MYIYFLVFFYFEGFQPMPMPTPAGPGAHPAPYPANYPPTSSYQPAPQANYQYPPTRYPQQQPPSYPPAAQPQATPPYPTSTVASETPVGSTAHKPLQSQVSVGDEAIKASLLSAVEEKLRRKLNETYDRYQVCFPFCNCSWKLLLVPFLNAVV